MSISNGLLKDAIEYADLCRSLSEVVRVNTHLPIPIIYFGNEPRYQSSPCKIVTIGLNPSSKEFREKPGDPLSYTR